MFKNTTKKMQNTSQKQRSLWLIADAIMVKFGILDVMVSSTFFVILK